jgi:hypothetical protein
MDPYMVGKKEKHKWNGMIISNKIQIELLSFLCHVRPSNWNADKKSSNQNKFRTTTKNVPKEKKEKNKIIK